ncbi:T9SS type A sorting domain-containing protein [Flavobacterium sedimenticola]|uniref:T9SS type A sorting domain-containing protein n=1 Tax=Flavobacterium sedimenticola TaxID=3043286 RepID=A0ABT6XS92_9FLAO|nr:T9SS type A sorting domain-containing protein [Flavobacterium sedimenticola]MDI9257883.1 T9SS type A sorting domain-containing protein [Flavobacterium sedimenticola]
MYDLDINNNILYATKISGTHNISFVNLNTPNQPQVFIENVYTPHGITIYDNTLYVAETIPAKISRINLSLQTPTLELLPISFSEENDYPWALKVYDNELYYSQTVMNIKKIGLNNLQDNPIPLVSYTGAPHDFVVEDNFIYTVETSIVPEVYPDRIIRLNLNDPFPPEPQQIVAIPQPKSIVKFQNYLFVGDNAQKIYRINLNLTNPMAELFYQADQNNYIGKIKLYNNEIYFPYMYEGSGGTVLSKILKFSQTTLSNEKSNLNEYITISPNPAQNILTIKLEDTIKEVTIYDLMGKTMAVNRVSNDAIDVSNLPKGMYLLRLNNENGKNLSTKFIKD